MNAQQQTIRERVLLPWIFVDRIAETGFGLAVLAGVAAIISGLGTRWGWWDYRMGLTLLRVSAISGSITVIVSIVGGVLARHERRRTIFLAPAAGILIGVLTVGIPWWLVHKAKQLPVINDITTDETNPPQFKAIIPLRVDAENSVVYKGLEVASQQRKAYPYIRPLVLPNSPAMSFDMALATAKNMGWQIINSNPKEGRIEAVATTFWFGFKDDIVIRVTPELKGSRVDMRSASRVGKGDIGTNAERVRTFLQSMMNESSRLKGSN
jgi:uncharacterized protein (DUF1499 family)